jgi:hypothetical protein
MVFVKEELPGRDKIAKRGQIFISQSERERELE